MIDASLSLEAAEGIKGLDLLRYLVDRGWIERSSRVDGISILSKRLPNADQPIELILPVKAGFNDEHRRIADALRAITQITGKSEAEIADEVRTFSIRDAETQATTGYHIRKVSDFRGGKAGFTQLLTHLEIENAARHLRENLGIAEDLRFNIVDLLEQKMASIIPEFKVVIFTATRTHPSEAYSQVTPPRIFLSSGVRDRALHGEPLSRFMIAHEMAHLLLHTDSLRSKSLSFDTGRFSKERIREEREASKFAAAFLMPIEVVRRIEDPQSLSHYCQVSLEAAQYRMTLIDQLRETSSPYRRIPQHLYKFLAQTFRLGKID